MVTPACSARFNACRSLMLLATCATSAIGQWNCPDPAWLPGEGSPSVDDTVYALTDWDPDGPGPQAPLVVVGGAFRLGFGIDSPLIVGIDPTSGQPRAFGSPFQLPSTIVETAVRALLVRSDRSLVVGGNSWDVEKGLQAGVAQGDGASWVAVGTGTGGGTSSIPPSVTALAETSSGEIIAGGRFAAMNGVTSPCIARFDGQAWHPLGTGLTHTAPLDFWVPALEVLADGRVLVGGSFTTAGGLDSKNLALWNPTSSAWEPVAGSPNGTVLSIVQRKDGLCVVAGDFTTAGGITANRIALWNAQTGAWTAMGTGMNNWVRDVTETSNGDIIAGGYFSFVEGKTANLIARWDGTAWLPLGSGLGSPSLNAVVRAVHESSDGRVWGGGEFDTGFVAPSDNLATWDGSSWTPPRGGLNGFISDFTFNELGQLLAGGQFEVAGPSGVSPVAIREGNQWKAVGTIYLGTNGFIWRLAALEDDRLLAAGSFNAGILLWDGQSWTPLGGGLTPYASARYPYVQAMSAPSESEVVIAGLFTKAGGVNANGLARYDGAKWSTFPIKPDGTINALGHMPNGDVIAGGNFQKSGTLITKYVARWNGFAWSGLGDGPNGKVTSMRVLGDQQILVGGFFNVGGPDIVQVARWDGASWSPVGTDLKPQTPSGVHTIQPMPNGDIIIGGSAFGLPGGPPYSCVARWDGVQWSPLLPEPVGQNPDYTTAYALAVMPSGTLAVGGYFHNLGNQPSPYFARYGCPPITCPADCDGDALLSINDFICFQTAYVLGDLKADCDANGSLSTDDFICFQTFFALGC